MAKAKKKRADKYDTKLAINGSFEEVIKVMVTPSKSEKQLEFSNEERCPTCGLIAQFVPPSERKGKILIVTFKCPNGHIFKKEYILT
jgi:hypothetical protein